MKVQIINCSWSTLWYRYLRGKEYEVEELSDTEYRVTEEGEKSSFIILKKDAKIIEK